MVEYQPSKLNVARSSRVARCFQNRGVPVLLPGRVIGVVDIDTFQSFDYSMTAGEARQRAETLRADFPTDVDWVRKTKVDFSAVVMKHVSHSWTKPR